MAEILPATSVHLTYELPQFQTKTANTIVLHNEVTVLNSHTSTYFCVVQFWPGGYCGIQQHETPQNKIAIFSMWNGEEKVKVIHQDSAVTVEPFGGEGEGLKCTRLLPWEIGEKVGFTIIVNKVGQQLFHIRCHLKFRGEELYTCTYEYKGEFPGQTMTTFIEDWNRFSGANGLLYLRDAHFSNAHYTINDIKTELKKAVFTKVEHGDDKHGGDRSGASVVGANFYLFTGGNRVNSATANNTLLTLK